MKYIDVTLRDGGHQHGGAEAGMKVTAIGKKLKQGYR